MSLVRLLTSCVDLGHVRDFALVASSVSQGNKMTNDIMALFHDIHADVFRIKGTGVCNLLCNA